ncbi:MAG: carbohydrate ABC transporter permease [Chloroflexi bacterium]|nr:carbohydrate ABC transporter permease [Chloroflexota bacterium]
MTGWLCNSLIVAALLLTYIPFVWLITTSLKQPVDAFAIPPVWVFLPTLENYGALLAKDFLTSYCNSLIIGLLTTSASLALGVPAAYALVRANFRGRAFMGTWILLVRLVPGVAFVIPMYIQFRNLGLTDTYLGLTIAYLTITLPFVVWMMTGYFQGVPQELEEAAVIDGCSRLGALVRVVLPVSTPGLATAALFSLVMSWNQYFYPLILGGRSTVTAPVAISNFLTFEGPSWGRLAAGGVLIVAPVLVFTLLSQNAMVRGLMRGAMK